MMIFSEMSQDVDAVGDESDMHVEVKDHRYSTCSCAFTFRQVIE